MKLDMPTEWHFHTEIKIRVTDLNYGKHLGNQQFLAFAQEARVQFFKKFGLEELNFGGVSLIQADAAIVFKGEGHLDDNLRIDVATEKTSGSSFNVFYKFTNLTKNKPMADIRTALVCFDYDTSRTVRLPEQALNSGIFS